MTYSEFKNKYALTLNRQQEEAVRQTEGPVLLLAVPGSGKTTVLVTRLGYMLYGKSIPPERILTVTYTVAATNDMKARFIHLFGETNADKLTFRTINGLCATVIQYYAWKTKAQPFSLITNESKINAILRDLLVQTGASYPGDQQIKDARTHITCCKNGMLTEQEIRACKVDGLNFPAVYFGYQEYLRSNRLMDYDDQMVFSYRIFRQYPEILAYFQRRWPYLCVDEAQDTSKIQHAILRLLSEKSRHIFMVGDEDQSIYGFRAAWPQALLEFEQIYPHAKILTLETNYRSTPAIVERADAFIQQNRSRHPKHMRTNNPPGAEVHKIMLSDYNRQYTYLLKIAENCTVSTAVLYRNNDSALPLIDLLEQKNIPYACRQRESFFFTSPVIRDLTDMLEFAFDDSNKDLFLRFYYKLDLKIKKTVLHPLLARMRKDETVFQMLLDSGKLEPWQAGKVKALQTHYSKIPYLSSFTATQRLVRFMGYGDYMKEQGLDTAKLDIFLSLANQTPVLGEFLLRLNELREKIEKQESMTDCPFVLSTIHASKGLEYDRTILIDVVDGIFPPASAAAGSEKENRQSALEEERRLFYVGTTRAKKQLEFLCFEKKFGEEPAATTFVSQFLGETPKTSSQAPAETSASGRRSSRSASPKAAQLTVWMKDILPGTEVTHSDFGWGVVMSRDGDRAVISFQETGVKKLDLPTCLRNNKLHLPNLL